MMDRELLGHIIEIKSTMSVHTEAIKNIDRKIDSVDSKVQDIQASCPVWEVEARVNQLEIDKRWYSKIIGVVGGFIGAATVVLVEWVFHKKG